MTDDVDEIARAREIVEECTHTPAVSAGAYRIRKGACALCIATALLAERAQRAALV